ncbi:MAG: YebC/PmpR family DNA-binding transcriptional regulator [Planctomycetes bacterium]|nr:YebC/PmpR family DNA-binding transcriptional regulator [Planctomycetota bacterium]
MAGHSHSANIQHRKAAVDAKKGAVFSKHAKLIGSAARIGGGDPAMNARLALAIEKARADNMPKERIDRAIKRGTGELEGQTFEEIRYEAYGPGGVAMLVDCLTDNRNRTASEMRKLLERFGGRLADAGSVAWMFEARARVEIAAEGVDEDRLTEAVMELGAEDLRREGDQFVIVGGAATLSTLHKGIVAAGFKAQKAEIAMIPQNLVTLDRANAEKILRLLDAFDEHDDVQTSHSNLEIPDDIIRELSAG